MESIEKTVLANLLASVENCKLFKERNFSEENFIFPEPKKFFQILWYHYEHDMSTMKQDSFESYIRRSTKITDDYAAKLLALYAELTLIPIASSFSVLLDEFLLDYKTTTLGNRMATATSILHDKNPDEAMEYLKAEVQKLQVITQPPSTESGFFGCVDVVDLYLKKKEHPELFAGIELGFPSMDSVITHKPGTVCLIMGQMKSAKSVLMINIARNLLSRGKKVYYHVNEGGAELVHNRLISSESGLFMSKIDRTRLSPEEFEIYKKCKEDIVKQNRLFVDAVPNSHSTASYIEQKLTQIRDTTGKCDVAIIDYLSIMNTSQHYDADWKKIGIISLELKDIAMKLNIPIITIMHVNRKGMQSDGKQFELDEIGTSLEPTKHVDTIMSWRIHEPELFELSNIGRGTLSIKGSRQSGQKAVDLDVDTNKMKIWENVRPITVTPSPLVTAGSTF